MGNSVQKEPFNGKYDGVTSPLLLPPGWISAGGNVRKVSPLGGWKARKGCTRACSTQVDSSNAVESLHFFKNPLQGNYEFIAQCNSKLMLANQDPPTAATSFSTLGVTAHATQPGFSCVNGEYWIYADGGASSPVVWAGDAAFPLGFIVYDSSAAVYNDYSRVIRDSRTDTYAIGLGAASDAWYIITTEPATEFTFDISSTNTNSETLVLEYWKNGAWTSCTEVDGTASSGKTMAQDGTVTSSDISGPEMRVVAGVMGYAYKITFSGALSGSINVVSVKVKMAANKLTNKWDGVFYRVAGCRYYDQSQGDYNEFLGKVSIESTTLYMEISDAPGDTAPKTVADYIYIKTAEPAAGFAFGIVDSYQNEDNVQIDLVEYWDGDSWETAASTGSSNLIDETLDDSDDSSFAKTGVIWIEDASDIVPQKRILEGDPVAGYWYRLSWDDATDNMGATTAVRIFLILYAPFPAAIPNYDGAVEFKHRTMLWGDPEFPNRLRYSSVVQHDCFCGDDSGYTDWFGDDKPIKAVVNFYNELLVAKEDSMWLLEGFSPETFGILRLTREVGIASPKTLQVVEVGTPGMHRNEPKTVAIWQSYDGVYILDGVKPRKVSGPVDHYFNPEYSTALGATYLEDIQAFIDKNNNEYHITLPGVGELVYNFVTDEWYPAWVREDILNTGLGFKATDNRYYTYGAADTGWVYRLENDTTDKVVATGADVAIDHWIKTRAIALPGEQGSSLRFTLRRLWAELKARTSGSVTNTLFRNMATTGTDSTTLSMVSSGVAVAMPGRDLAIEDCVCFQTQFEIDSADVEMEIYSFEYELSPRGVPVI